MKITKIVENPIFRTKIKSDNVKIPEMIIGYFLAPFCAMLANSIFGAYLNRYYVDVLGWTRFGVFATMLPVISVIWVAVAVEMVTTLLVPIRSGTKVRTLPCLFSTRVPLQPFSAPLEVLPEAS